MKIAESQSEIVLTFECWKQIPICVETMGVWGPKGYKFIKKVGKLISDTTMERRSTSFLRQSISMEIQTGNCASILGTVESPRLLEELFDLGI